MGHKIKRITFLILLLSATLPTCYAQEYGSIMTRTYYPVEGEWVSRTESGGKYIIKITYSGESFILKEKFVASNGKTTYYSTEVEKGYQNSIYYVQYITDNVAKTYTKKHRKFTVENGVGHDYSIKETTERNGSIISEKNCSNEPKMIFYKDDPNW